MTDFVLEQDLEIPIGRTAGQMVKYGLFLKQPLTLGMFVPCDLEGNVLEEPLKRDYNNVNINNSHYKKYQEAKYRVLFEGWIYKKDFMGFKKVYNSDFQINLDTLDCEFYIDGMHYEDFKLKGNNIESLSNQLSGVLLTSTAQKQIL